MAYLSFLNINQTSINFLSFTNILEASFFIMLWCGWEWTLLPLMGLIGEWEGASDWQKPVEPISWHSTSHLQKIDSSAVERETDLE